MRYKVLVTEEIARIGTKLLEDNGYEIKMGTGISEEIVMKEIEDCDAILTRNAIITEKIMCAAPKLKVISMHGVGVDNIDVATATKMGIQVTNAADSNKLSVAEYTIGLILDLSRNILLYDRELRAGNWSVRKTSGMDIEGRTLGIIGMGNIGSLVAQKAAMGFGMKVLAYKRNLASAVPMQGVTYTDDLDKVIENADFLSLHVPYSAETEKLIGERELSLMKPKAYLINTARGEVVDTKALYNALESKKIAGAAVDVFDGEIPDMSDPLLQLDNIIVTPHTAAFTTQSLSRMALHSAMGVHEVLSDRKPTWPVNKLYHVSMHS